jgi:uncharacterized protein VirK/YbjX
MSAESNNSRMIASYVKDMKKEFKSEIQKFIFQRLKSKYSWKLIHKNLKFHISKLLESTDDYKTLKDLLENDKSRLRDIESSIVNKTYKIVAPFVERAAKEEAENKRGTRRAYPESLLRRSFALQYLTRRHSNLKVPVHKSAPKNETMTNRASPPRTKTAALNMRSLMNALNGI